MTSESDRSRSRSETPQKTVKSLVQRVDNSGSRKEKENRQRSDSRSPSPRRRDIRNERGRVEDRSRGDYSRRGEETDRSWRWQHERRSKSRSSGSPDVKKRKQSRSPSPGGDKPTSYAQRGERDIDDWFAKKRKTDQTTSDVATKAGGAYIPPAKLRMMQKKIGDKSSEEYQRINWELLKKKIHGYVNKVNVTNLQSTIGELLQQNVVRGKGLLARSVIQAQSFSPTFSHVYAAFVAVINSKFPHIGELVLRRLIIQFKRSFKRNDKQTAINCTKFIAHLINQQVAHELLALEVLTLLLEVATDDSVEVAIAFLKECGAKLTELTPKGMNAIYDRFRAILSDGQVDARVQYMIEVAFAVRKDKFSAHPAVVEELDLIDESEQITHTVTLDDAVDPENVLNVFKFDPEFEKNEEMYDEIKKDILGEGSDAEDDEEDDAEGAEAEAHKATETQTIVDETETNLVAFRRTVYLTIQSSLDFQECAHKLLKMNIKPGMEVELCHMMLDCCAQQRTFEKFYGLLAERFCRLKKEYQGMFEQIFKDTYDTIHRFELTKLRNATKLFSHLLYTDAISWEVLGHIKLNEDDTTSSSRIFIKILFQELAEFLGMEKLYERIRDATMQQAFDGIFPRDNPRDTRFAINFFTSIGLGGLTVDLREHLKSGPTQPAGDLQLPAAPVPEGKVKVESSSESESDSEDDSSSTDSEEERKRRKAKKSSEKERSDKHSKKSKKSSSSRHKKSEKSSDRKKSSHKRH